MNKATYTRINTVALLFVISGVSVGCSTTVDRSSSSQQDQAKIQENVNIVEMLTQARGLLKDGQLDAATDEFEWLWENMLDYEYSMRGVRLSFMAGDMEKLASQHPPARKRFEMLRDNARAKIDESNSSSRYLRDWIVLNTKVLNDIAPVLVWIEIEKSSPDGIGQIQRHHYLIKDLLTEHGNLAVLGQAIPPGEKLLSQARSIHARTTDHQNDGRDDFEQRTINRISDEHFVEKLAQSHIALLAAGRDEDAWLVLNGAAETLDTPESHTTLLKAAMNAHLLQNQHLVVLAKAEPKLIEQCQAYLAEHRQ